jgi:hypothetical protein
MCALTQGPGCSALAPGALRPRAAHLLLVVAVARVAVLEHAAARLARLLLMARHGGDGLLGGGVAHLAQLGQLGQAGCGIERGLASARGMRCSATE